MQHGERPTVNVTATLLEGLCYSNKLVVSYLPLSRVLPDNLQSIQR